MSVRELQREIEIDAPAAAVWDALTTTSAYPEWNPFIRRIEGELREGARLEVRIEPPGARGMTFKPTVLTVEAGRELSWLGRFLVRGLFDGEHSFHLEELPGGRTRFVQKERFSGLLVGPFGRMLDRTASGFDAMNLALRDCVEAAVQPVASERRSAPASAERAGTRRS